MPFEASELRISLHKLVAGLVLAIVPLSFAGLYVTSRSDKLLEEALGSQYKANAESASAMTAQYIGDRVKDCLTMAADPAIAGAMNASNAANQRAPEAAVSEKIAKIEKEWNGPGPEGAAKAILASPAAKVLQIRRRVDPRFLLIVAADERGVAVAASDKPANYVEGNSPFWADVYAEGRGAVSVRNAAYDDASRTNYIGIAVPVKDESSGRFIGAVSALIDLSPMLAQLNAAGAMAKTTLVKEDGTIVGGPGVNLSMNLKSEQFAAVRDSMGTPEGRQAGYVVADLRGGKRSLVGFADAKPGGGIPQPGWVTLVSQDVKTATAPLRAITLFAFAMVLLGLLLLSLATMYFFVHKKEEFAEIEALHEAPRQWPAHI